MNCLYLDLPINTRVENPESKTVEQIMREVGGNTGNLMFRHAVSTHIADTLLPTHWAESVDLAKREGAGCVVMACANWLDTDHSFGNEKRARYLEELGLPAICIGLGCQHPVPTTDKLQFPEATVRLLKVLKSLDAYVLVRDDTTYHQCRHYGLEKVYLTGCPSNFINAEADFAKTLLAKSKVRDFRNVTLNAGYFYEESLEHDLRLLAMLKDRHQFRYLVQTNEFSVAALAMGRYQEAVEKDIHHLKGVYQLGGWKNRLLGRFKSWCRGLGIYTDVERWIADARTWDLALGSRIHGSMAAIQAGTPALLTAIDSRTHGLASQMQIPHIDLKEFLAWDAPRQLDDLLNRVELDYTAYLDKRRELSGYYSEILEDFGLKVSECLLTIRNQ